MSISTPFELAGMKKVSEVVGTVLKQMREHAEPDMTTKDLDEYGGQLLKGCGARSAPKMTYGFPGWTFISVNNEIAHGIPSDKKILKQGDLINVDVSAELNGFWSDNGGSFVLGNDINNHQPLVNVSKQILFDAINNIRDGVKVADIGHLIETEAKKSGYKVIRNLAGHGVGKALHERPEDILNYKDRSNKERFKRNSVVAIETFIATHSNLAIDTADGWTLIGNKNGFVCQHEHTIVVTDKKPIILTESNEIWS